MHFLHYYKGRTKEDLKIRIRTSTTSTDGTKRGNEHAVFRLQQKISKDTTKEAPDSVKKKHAVSLSENRLNNNYRHFKNCT